MRKLAFVIDSLGIGGKEKRCLQLIKGLTKEHNIEIHLIIFDDIIEYTKISNHNLIIHTLSRSHPKDVYVFYKLFRLIIKLKPEIILSWSLMSSFWLNIINFFTSAVYISAFVANCNKPSTFSLANIARILSIYSSKMVIGNSEAGLIAYKIPKKKARLISNGYDFENLKKARNSASIKSQFNINTKYVVTMAARVSSAKDHDTYLKSADLISNERKDVTFLVVGDGPLLKEYQILYQYNEQIKFTGVIENIEDIIYITDICVLCSPSEGISNFLLESMAMRKPVIATSTGATPELVLNGITGYLINHKDFVILKEKLINLLNDSELRSNLGANAFAKASREFSLETMTDKFYNLFKDLLSKYEDTSYHK